MTVLERQRARVMRQGQKVHDAGSSLDAGRFHELLMLGGDVFNQKTVKSDPRWPQLRGSEVRSTVCNGKRKFDKEEDICRDKKRGGPMTAEEDDDKEYSKMTGQITATTHKSNKSIRRNKGNSGSDISSKVVCSDVLQSDFIHVRARRGQATDSHSLSERARREKISERMKYLEDLVPGCNNITGKAGILDEIINYVQSLQTQIEFLSMKLATSNPVLDLNIHNLIEPMFSPLATLDEMPLEMSHLATYLQMQQVGGPPISDADTFSDTSWFNQLVSNAPTTLDELHNCYCSSHDLHHARDAASLMSSHQIFNGLEGNRKVEMG